MKAQIIALEGIDQSGKQTQARLLATRLNQRRCKTTIISFPVYRTSTGRQIRDYLTRKKTYSPQALHMLFSLNRWENQETIQRLVSENDFVITDRYTPSNLAYGASRGLDPKWLESLDKGLPKPDLVVVLDTSIQSSFARKSSHRDVHESNSEFLVKVRHNYKILARKLGWKIVDASYPVGQVESIVWSTVRNRFHITPIRKARNLG